MKKKLSAALALAVILTVTACSREDIPLDIPVTESENITVKTEGATEETDASEAAAETTASEETSLTEAVETKTQTQTVTSAYEPPDSAAEATEPPATAAAVTEPPAPRWTETAVSPTLMYINSEGVYSRVEPIQGSTKVAALGYNQEVTVYSKTDTSYFKIENGSYVHSAFLSSEKAVITTTTTAAPPTTAAEAVPSIIGQYNQRSQTQAEIDFADKVFDLTNAEREKAGLPKLKKMQEISEMANTRAWELTLSPTHKRPDGSSSSSVLNGMPYSAVGENLAAGQATPEDVMNAWMNSEGHRANILSSDYEYLGIGYYNVNGTDYTNYWIQIFYK